MLKSGWNYLRYLEEKLGIPVHVTERKLELGYYESLDAEIAKERLLLSYDKRCEEILKQLEEILKQFIDLQEDTASPFRRQESSRSLSFVTGLVSLMKLRRRAPFPARTQHLWARAGS